MSENLFPPTFEGVRVVLTIGPNGTINDNESNIHNLYIKYGVVNHYLRVLNRVLQKVADQVQLKAEGGSDAEVDFTDFEPDSGFEV